MTDRELVRQSQGGDAQAFAELVERCRHLAALADDPRPDDVLGE